MGGQQGQRGQRQRGVQAFGGRSQARQGTRGHRRLQVSVALTTQVDHGVAAQQAEAGAALVFKGQEFHASNPKRRAGLSTRIFLRMASSPA